MKRLASIALCTAACVPTLTNGRYQVRAAKVADLSSVNAGWEGPGDERVRLEIGYSVWITRPDSQGCPEIGMGLRHGHHEDRWVDGAELAIEGEERHVLPDPRYSIGAHWDEVSVKTPKPALQALVGGGHILVGAQRYELDDSVRTALAELLENHRCEPPPPEPVAKDPLEATDPCAEYQRNQLSPEEHERRYGCPPCPCSCVNGELVCAPCAACESFGPPRPEPQRATP